MEDMRYNYFWKMPSCKLKIMLNILIVTYIFYIQINIVINFKNKLFLYFSKNSLLEKSIRYEHLSREVMSEKNILIIVIKTFFFFNQIF